MIYFVYMKDANSIRSIIQSHSDKLRSFGVARIGIFGSVSQGKATASSDVDVLLDFNIGKKTYRNFIGTTTFLEKILHNPVDAITPDSVSPYIKPYIEKDIQYVQI